MSIDCLLHVLTDTFSYAFLSFLEYNLVTVVPGISVRRRTLRVIRGFMTSTVRLLMNARRVSASGRRLDQT